MNPRPPYQIVEDQIQSYTNFLEELREIDAALQTDTSPMVSESRAVNRRLIETYERELPILCKIYTEYTRDART